MEQYWGERGEVWGSEDGASRTWAIIALTVPGVELIQLAKAEMQTTCPDGALRELRGKKLNEAQKSLLSAALEQGEKLVRLAAQDWKHTNAIRPLSSF